MSSRLVIVGAGGFGREVHSWVESSPRWSEAADIGEVVFIDDAVPEIPVRASLVSTVKDYVPEARDLVICAIGSPKVRARVTAELRARGASFATFIHDRATRGDGVELGCGAVICPNVVLTTDIVVGEHVHINVGSTIGHDVTIGDFVTMSSACNLTGGVTVGAHAFLATAVTIIPGVRIGAGAYLGAGSVVLKDVAEETTVFGNPSKSIGKRTV